VRAALSRIAGRGHPGPGARALLALTIAGVGLRCLFMFAYRPALLGYPDTYIYLTDAHQNIFYDPLRPVGYPFFLRIVHAVNDNLSFATLVQHGLGILTALTLYATVRRITGRPWAPLLPSAVVLLGGDQIYLEHAILSEALYTVLVAFGLYAAVRTRAGGWGWAAAAGGLIALSATVRLAGLVLVPVLVIWFLVASAPGWRARVLRSATVAVTALAVLGGYLLVAHDATGRWSFARNGVYGFYGRVATFADCSRFDAPPGTEGLCDPRPKDERPESSWYIFQGPVVKQFGEPQVATITPERARLLGRFTRAAAIAQPLDWLEATSGEFTRYVAPDSRHRGGPNAGEYRHMLTRAEGVRPATRVLRPYYSTGGVRVDAGLMSAVHDYEGFSRVEGPVMALLLVLGAAAAFVTRGPVRRESILLLATSLAMLIGPPALVGYEGRYGVPAYGPLAAAAAIGAAAILERYRRRAP
jgi:hypothetical protein